MEIKPPFTGAKVAFAGAFDLDFGFTLRERRSTTLDQIQNDALEIESNLGAANKAPETQPTQDKGRAKEETSQNQTLEDMNKAIKICLAN